MADFTTIYFDITGYTEADGYATSAVMTPTVSAFFSEATTGPSLIQTYYLMRWLDVDCSPTITYRTWVVTGTPDPTGIKYAGTKCGGTAVAAAVVAASWQI